MQEVVTCHWFCESCNNKVGKIFPNLVNLHERMNNNEKAIAKVENEVEKTNGHVIKLKSDVNKISNELNGFKIEMDTQLREVRKEMADVITVTKAETKTMVDMGKTENDNYASKLRIDIDKKIDDKIISVSSEVDNMNKAVESARALAAEEQDKESRRCNIILHRVQESEADNADERNIHDKRFCVQFLTGLNVGLSEDDIRKTVRLGRFGQTSAPRPLLVQFENRLAKNLTMESLFKIRHMEAKFKSIIVTHDMTKMEREECKTLVERAKAQTRMEQSGEWMYQVRGPPSKMVIVKLRKRQT